MAQMVSVSWESVAVWRMEVCDFGDWVCVVILHWYFYYEHHSWSSFNHIRPVKAWNRSAVPYHSTTNIAIS